MGASSRRTDDENKPLDPRPRRAPSDRPPFTLADIKRAIPSHCFRRCLPISLSYLARDVAAASSLFYLAITFIPRLTAPLSLFAWPLYWTSQGFALTAVWALAHECGHGAFSDYPLLNDIVGFVLHSALLVPYFSFKHSHRRHHANTGSMDTDEVFVPKTFATQPVFLKLLLKNPAGRFLYLVATLTLGWPAYLAFNISGRRYPRWTSHFDPYSPIYIHRERAEIVASDAGLFALWYVLFRLAGGHSWGWVARVYGVPLLVLNGMLVVITYLQHTHATLPHYDAAEWEWLRGTLATVDRDFGRLLNGVLHHVVDTHVLHHLFPAVPHYHAVEATEAMKRVLGEYYRVDRTNVFKAAWRETRECIYVEPDEGPKSKGILWYSNRL